MKKNRITVEMNEELYGKTEQASKRLSISKSALVRMVITKYLEQQ